MGSARATHLDYLARVNHSQTPTSVGPQCQRHNTELRDCPERSLCRGPSSTAIPRHRDWKDKSRGESQNRLSQNRT